MIKRIPETFKDRENGYSYRLVERKEDVALYQFMESILGYEVHIIREQKAGEITKSGKTFKIEHKEKLARNEDFGTYGWHYPKLETAKAKMESLIADKERNRHAICVIR